MAIEQNDHHVQCALIGMSRKLSAYITRAAYRFDLDKGNKQHHHVTAEEGYTHYQHTDHILAFLHICKESPYILPCRRPCNWLFKTCFRVCNSNM